VAFAAATILAVSLHTRRSELIQKDDYYLGPLWRTKSDSENVLGSLALTGHVGEPSVDRAHSKVFRRSYNLELWDRSLRLHIRQSNRPVNHAFRAAAVTFKDKVRQKHSDMRVTESSSVDFCWNFLQARRFSQIEVALKRREAQATK
jgi:hypothetical protein